MEWSYVFDVQYGSLHVNSNIRIVLVVCYGSHRCNNESLLLNKEANVMRGIFRLSTALGKCIGCGESGAENGSGGPENRKTSYIHILVVWIFFEHDVELANDWNINDPSAAKMNVIMVIFETPIVRQ